MTTLIKNAQVYDSGRFYPANLNLKNGVIHAIESPSSVGIGIDVHNRFVIPGLIDAHAHLTLSANAERYGTLTSRLLHGVHNAKQHLIAGVTSVRDMGGPGAITVEMKQAIEAGTIPGPRAETSASFVCTTGGHVHYWGREADGVSEVTKAVREQFKAGAGFIKIMASGGVADDHESPELAQYSQPELEAIVAEAARHGSYVAAHAHPAEAIKNCIIAGVKTIEHASFLNQECIDLALANDVTIVPTFSVYVRMAHAETLPQKQRDLAMRVLEKKSELFLHAVSEGVRWGVGTDAGTFQPPGTLADELVYLASLGIPTRDVIDAATIGNSALLPSHGVGKLAAGRKADLVVLHENPLINLETTQTPALVFKGGECITPATARPAWSTPK